MSVHSFKGELTENVSKKFKIISLLWIYQPLTQSPIDYFCRLQALKVDFKPMTNQLLTSIGPGFGLQCLFVNKDW